MQIISGIYKNKKLIAPNTDKTHPMGSREKMALFNMIMPYLSSSIVLDAFSGSGAIGLEAISRGASKVTLVENSGKVAKIIKENLENLGEEAKNKAEIIVKNVEKLEFAPESFDIIIADPPYTNFDTKCIENLEKFLKNDGIFVLSHPGNAPKLTNLSLLKSHGYAAANISLYKKP